jgi:HKD family nuclease
MKASLLTQIAPENRLLNRLGPEARTARSAFVAVSFIQRAGMKHLFKSLKVLLDRSLPVTVYTSGYLGITDPKALEDLLRLCDHYESLRVFFNAEDRFHSKFFFFEKPGDTYSLFLGSSNVSVGGFADTGELNAHIRGKSTDAICRDIQTVMANLEKNRNFEPLSEDAIRAYRKRHGDKRPKSGPTVKRPRVYLRPEEMPIFVVENRFTGEECKRIEGKHPEWGNYISYTARLKRLKRGDHFLCITKLRGQKPTFTTSRYLEHDRSTGVGTVACVDDGDSLPLARLAKHFKVEAKDLVRMKGLDVYSIAILRRDFPGTLA